MALTGSQLKVLQLISKNRTASGNSYFPGGAALNALLDTPRLSEDIDIFNDVKEAVKWGFDMDCATLESAGYKIYVERELDTFIDALVRREEEVCRLQWTQDSAYRFFPLVEHPDFGLVLHPFDLATNKVLALVGRAVPRDWVDIIECDSRLQPFGYLVWAAASKDPGLNPTFILEQATRSARYTEGELTDVTFETPRPTAVSLATKWKAILAEAKETVAVLPWRNMGDCVLDAEGKLLRLDSKSLVNALANSSVRFHSGSLHGAIPVIV